MYIYPYDSAICPSAAPGTNRASTLGNIDFTCNSFCQQDYGGIRKIRNLPKWVPNYDAPQGSVYGFPQQDLDAPVTEFAPVDEFSRCMVQFSFAQFGLNYYAESKHSLNPSIVLQNDGNLVLYKNSEPNPEILGMTGRACDHSDAEYLWVSVRDGGQFILQCKDGQQKCYQSLPMIEGAVKFQSSSFLDVNCNNSYVQGSTYAAGYNNSEEDDNIW